MPKNFQRLMQRISPTVLRGHYGSRLRGMIAVGFDSVAQMLNDAVRAPWAGTLGGPAYDAVGPLGNEHSLPRYPDEPWEQYAARQATPWATWELAGTQQRLLDELALYKPQGVSLQAEIKYDHDWNWDGTSYWSRFWVVIHVHPWTGPRVLGDGSVLDGSWTLGSSATPDEVRTVRNIVRKWKPTRWICDRIIIVLDPVAWAAAAPDGTWNVPWNRSASAAYWGG